jgi:phage head maturation protease
LQRDLSRLRNRQVRGRMRAILSYQPRTYNPSGDFDPEVIFREMISSGALDQCLNGG